MNLKQLIDQMIDAALCDAGDHLRLAKVRRAEQDVQQGRIGEAAYFTQILVLHNEYDRRANLVLDCIRRALEANASPKQDPADSFESLRTLYNKYVKANTKDITLALLALPQNGKPTFAEHKATLDRKILAELALATGQHQSRLDISARSNTMVDNRVLRKVVNRASNETAEKIMAGIGPMLRTSRLIPDPKPTDSLLEAFAKERPKHATNKKTFEELARMDIATAREKGQGLWLRRSESVKHYNARLNNNNTTTTQIKTRAAALERAHRRAINNAKHPVGKK